MDSDPDSPPPDWWATNETLRDRLDLPSYTPPRFRDGVYMHTVKARVERDLDRTVRILGVNTMYPDDLGVYVDGERLFSIARHRDESGNTVYEMTAGAFRNRLEREL